ncbi:MAG: hypothetical protein COX06_01340 [Candidatus Zambryskibacteria bacterium CG22_combo_CG10-13_8_21_14_all_42_17]|uniref:Uncharacterized protein n=1 Tax=Candidatus Zambryskibacteria bacterium CG22_combo_CG10-13_8_21_14_all_42_17 TaxID=1975118 RepID=A0A2H0BDZ2_9BACT|nr:MAG: hypothetical protein COX06_01340 [Candidatus Zambryskibacteria bacterium CG22_combo_CG10-13_8_21_14_all_42_17]
MQISFKKYNWKVQGKLFGFGVSPDSDWKIILISTIILIISVIAFSAFIFVKIDKEEIFVMETSEGHEREVINTTNLRETVLHYQNKAVEFESIKGAVIQTADPSL